MIDFHKEVIYLTPEDHTGYRPSNQPMLEKFAKNHQGFRIEWFEPRRLNGENYYPTPKQG